MNQRARVFDLMVIGAGFAGMAAALFAANRGMSVAQAGATGGIDFSTGFIDVMGVHPIAEGRRWDDPWAAIRAVSRECPGHPYALLAPEEIRSAIDEFTEFLAGQGLGYVGHPDRNTRIATPVGTVKRTYRVPATAWQGAEALEKGAPTLIADFHGLKGFSGIQIVETLGKKWPGLRTVRLDFPGLRGELYPEHMAWSLSDPVRQEELARSLEGRLDGVEYVGFPAVLGLLDPMRVLGRMRELLGREVFEIPTLPPCIAGPRLRAAFDRGLPPLGVASHSQKLVFGVHCEPDGAFAFQLGKPSSPVIVRARSAILASGRFFGKGLKADRAAISESVFGLPVAQPESRSEWHRERFHDPRGHPANMAGIETDAELRPLNAAGEPAYPNLRAAGAVLAHQDWMRMKCGAGLAVATARKAVMSLVGKN